MNLKTLLIAASLGAAALPGIGLADPPAPGTTLAYIADSTLTTKVKAALLAEKNLHSLDIKVVTVNGAVQLSGYVMTNDQIGQAVLVAQNVSGVREVKSDLLLKGETRS
jgi:hyperosmotically inducible protein